MVDDLIGDQKQAHRFRLEYADSQGIHRFLQECTDSKGIHRFRLEYIIYGVIIYKTEQNLSSAEPFFGLSSTKPRYSIIIWDLKTLKMKKINL